MRIDTTTHFEQLQEKAKRGSIANRKGALQAMIDYTSVTIPWQPERAEQLATSLEKVTRTADTDVAACAVLWSGCALQKMWKCGTDVRKVCLDTVIQALDSDSSAPEVKMSAVKTLEEFGHDLADPEQKKVINLFTDIIARRDPLGRFGQQEQQQKELKEAMCDLLRVWGTTLHIEEAMAVLRKLLPAAGAEVLGAAAGAAGAAVGALV